MAVDRGRLLRAVARDLTALHDPDLILTGLVRRVRSALGCDLAYVSLNDPQTRQTRIRFSDGVRTPEYAAIRMPIGTGVLGMAAAGVTTESPDYLPDLARLHIEAVDLAVNAEGVRAILGTPLRSGGEVVGALTVANRTPGGFSKAQRAALEEAALVGSAAAEIHLLRRRSHEREEHFARELERLAADAVATSDRLRVSTELTAALATGHGTSELLSIASHIVGGVVRLADDRGAEPETGDPGVVSAPLEAGGAIEVVGGDPARIAGVAPVIAAFVSIAILYERAIEDARHLRESELVERLVDPPPGASGQQLRTGLAGTGELDVVVVELQDPQELRAALASVRARLGARAIAASRRGSLVAITRGGSGATQELERAIPSVRFFAGVATAGDDAAIPEAFGAASLIARSMRALRRPGELGMRSQLGVVAFAVGGAPDDADRYISAQLGPLTQPTARGRALLETALRYLDAQGSVAAVAAELSIHENTVRQRLEKLDELLGGWRTGPRSLDVHVALRAHALRAAGSAGA